MQFDSIKKKNKLVQESWRQASDAIPHIPRRSDRFFFWSVVLVAVLGVTALSFAWQNPTTTPPGGNVSGFLDTSSTAQTKTGSLTIATSTYLATTGGNVGIGTTSPGGKLHIVGQSRISGSSLARLTIEPEGGTTNLWNFDNQVGILRIFREDYAASGGGANGAVRMAILDNGNVGIGTTGPDHKFEVEAADGSNLTDYLAHVNNLDSTSGQGHGLRITAGNDAGDGSFYVRSRALSPLFLVRGDGNVGIGTTGPGAKLQISEGSVWPQLTAIAESAVPPNGLSIQGGPGGTNTQGWAYPYGTRLSAITGGGRSFEIMTTTYPDGQLAVRTLNGSNVWDAWKLILDSSKNVASSGNLQISGGGPHYFSSGNVGIGTTGPTDELTVGTFSQGNLSLSGSLTGYAAKTYPTLKTNGACIYFDAQATYTGYICYNGGFVDVSDERSKTNITTISSALDKISQINGVTFNWKDGRDNKRHMGVLAQEVEKVAPELVSQPDGIDTKGVFYGGLNALTIEAIKELDMRTKDLTSTSDGDIIITGDSPDTYAVTAPTGITERIGAYARLVAAHVKTGLIETKELVVNGSVNVASNIRAGLVIAKEVTSKKITVENLSAKNLELVDQITGEIYCVGIKNGEWFQEKGSCQ